MKASLVSRHDYNIVLLLLSKVQRPTKLQYGSSSEADHMCTSDDALCHLCKSPARWPRPLRNPFSMDNNCERLTLVIGQLGWVTLTCQLTLSCAQLVPTTARFVKFRQPGSESCTDGQDRVYTNFFLFQFFQQALYPNVKLSHCSSTLDYSGENITTVIWR